MTTEALRHIAHEMDHTGPGEHIHEPTTGGPRFCPPCYAWRVLNGSPNAHNNTTTDLLQAAWGIIANTGQGNWHTETNDWRTAALEWRDDYHRWLATNAKQDAAP